MPKVALAYSGGLDTSVAIRWLQEKYQMEVIAVAVDVGEERDYDSIRQKALDIGAVKSVVEDGKQEFARDFIFPALKANALYEGKYPVSTALARPLIAKVVAQVAAQEKADVLAHGATGKGNDQVRFEVSWACLCPEMKVIAPVREWEMTREQEMEYAQAHSIPVPTDKQKPYSIDVNLWGRSAECGVLEDPWTEPPADVYEWTKAPDECPDSPAYVEIGFQEGLPNSLDGKELDPVDLIGKLNALGGEHGAGRVDMVENRLVGIKSREVYECPAATILLAAHRDLETLTLERETYHFKQIMEQKYAELVYYGLWFAPLRQALDAFMDSTQSMVTGTVRMKLFKGSCTPVGRRSPSSLYRYDLATYDKGDQFDQKASKGFVDLWGLPGKVASLVEREKKK